MVGEGWNLILNSTEDCSGSSELCFVPCYMKNNVMLIERVRMSLLRTRSQLFETFFWSKPLRIAFIIHSWRRIPVICFQYKDWGIYFKTFPTVIRLEAHTAQLCIERSMKSEGRIAKVLTFEGLQAQLFVYMCPKNFGPPQNLY